MNVGTGAIVHTNIGSDDGWPPVVPRGSHERATGGNTILANTAPPTADIHPLQHALHSVLERLAPRPDDPHGRLIHAALTTVVSRHRPGVRHIANADAPSLAVCLECATLSPPPDDPRAAWADEVYPCATLRGIVVSLWDAVDGLPADTAARWREGVEAAMYAGETIAHWLEEAERDS